MPESYDISLDDNKDLSQPMDGDMANHIAKLITSLSEIEIASLAETVLSRLLPKAEIDRLLVPFLQPVVCRMTEALFIDTSDADLGQRIYRDVGVPCFTFCICGFVGMISIDCGRNIYQWWSNKRLLSSEVTTNAATVTH